MTNLTFHDELDLTGDLDIVEGMARHGDHIRDL